MILSERRRHKHIGTNISPSYVVKIWATANRLREFENLEDFAVPYGFCARVRTKLEESGIRLKRDTIQLWLSREEAGQITHMKRTGRPTHSSFNTRTKKHRARKRLKSGFTQKHVAKLLYCDRKTLRKYSAEGTAGLKFYRLNEGTPLTKLNQKDRRRYARWRLTCQWRPSVSLTTFADDKRVYMYRVNKLNAGIWANPSDENLHLRKKIPKRNYELNLHFLFFVNSSGSGLFPHFSVSTYNRSGKHHLAGDPKFTHRTVNAAEVQRSLLEAVFPFMITTGSTELVWDGARSQHTDLVHTLGRDLCHDNYPMLIPENEIYDIVIHPSAHSLRKLPLSAQRSTPGYPGNSHDCNAPCEVAFATLQYRIGKYFVNNPRKCNMQNLLTKVTEEWPRLLSTCVKLISQQRSVMRAIRDCGGRATFLHNGFLDTEFQSTA